MGLSKTEKRLLLDEYKRSLTTFREFAKFCVIYGQGEDGFIPFVYESWYEEQRLFEEKRTGFDLVLKTRQVGFSTMECMRDFYFALTHEGSTVCIVAQTEETAKDLLARIRYAYSHLKEVGEKAGVPLVPKLSKDNAFELSFEGRGKIIATWCKRQEKRADETGRGLSITRLHCSEVAIWEHDSAAMRSLMNAAKDAQEIVLESTPKGARGYFYELCRAIRTGERRDFRVHFYPFYLHSKNRKPVDPLFDPAPRDQYEEKLRAHGCDDEQIAFWRFQVAKETLDGALQEYAFDELLCFRSSDATFLRIEDLDWLSGHTEPPEHVIFLETCRVNIWDSAQPGTRYIIGADASNGAGQDFSAAYVLNKETGKIVAATANNEIPPFEFASVLAQLGNRYNTALIAIERNGPGVATVEALQKVHRYPRLYREKGSPFIGWDTNAKTRPAMYSGLQESIRDRSLPVIDRELVEELRHFIVNPKTQKMEAAEGQNDDRVASYAIALRVRAIQPTLKSDGYQSVAKSTSHLGTMFGRKGTLKGFL